MAHKPNGVIFTSATNITHIESVRRQILKYFAQEIAGGLAFFSSFQKLKILPISKLANELAISTTVLFFRVRPRSGRRPVSS